MNEQEQILWDLEHHGRPYNEWVLGRALPFVGGRLLEVGAGIGTFTMPLAAEGRQVAAVEPDAEFAEILEQRVRELPNVSVHRQDVLELTPEAIGGSVDSVLCFNVLEHIRDDGAALASMHQCLKTGGRLLLLSPAHPFLFGETDRAVDHQRRYRRSGLHDLLTRVGFEVEELRYVNPVGAVGWLVSSRLMKRPTLPARPLSIFGTVVPILRLLDRVPIPFGLSVWARAKKTT